MKNSLFTPEEFNRRWLPVAIEEMVKGRDRFLNLANPTKCICGCQGEYKNGVLELPCGH